MSGSRLVVSVLVSIASMLPVALEAQRTVTPPPQVPSDFRPGRVLVDGSKNPERIPDRIAIGMFISAITIPAPADKLALRRFESQIGPLKLSPSDKGILRTELARLHGRLVTHRETMTAARDGLYRSRTPANAAAFTAAVEARDALAVDSYGRLLEVLSSDGARKLQAHIGAVKRQIKEVGPAQVP